MFFLKKFTVYSWLFMQTIIFKGINILSNMNGCCRLFQVKNYFLLLQTIQRTKENVEKKQALTYEEMEAEREEVISTF